MYNYNLKNKELIDRLRSGKVYEYNMAQNLALLSNDSSVIREFFQIEQPKYFKDTWLAMSSPKFMAYYQDGQAFTYFGLIPMIVNAKVNLVASAGFNCKSDDGEVDDALNKAKEECDLEQKFTTGVYWESGIGDVAFRISVDTKVSDKPIIDVIEPQMFEVNYYHGCIKSFVIKEVSREDPNYEMREIHHKNDAGFVCIDYRYYANGHYVAADDDGMIKECALKFDTPLPESKVLPFRDFLVIFKKNSNNNQLYRGERGVPDIQGLVLIEDALTESASDLIDAIRKGGVKEYVSDELIPQDIKGNDLRLNHFNKTVITTQGSSTPGDSQNLWKVVQGDIKWEAYTRTMQNLMSIGINKAGLSPTTLGLTGLESINSSQESQDAREKPSMRTRQICLNAWGKTLKEILNRYLQVRDYMQGMTIIDYSDLINITFNEYTNPTLENVTDVLAKQVQTGLKSQMTAIKDLNEGMSEKQVEQEYAQIQAENGQGQTMTGDGTEQSPQGQIPSSGTQKVMLFPFK